MLKIISYSCAWNLKLREGRIKIRLENNEIKTLSFSSGGEYSAVLMMLQGDDDPKYHEGHNIIASGSEIPGEE